jgi:alkylation response protein AidB-like acyl-CoA dehydrogenase
VIGKLSLVAAFGAGYVLGAKAGTQRYEKIRRTAQGIAEQPLVHSATEKVQAKAAEAVDAAKGIAAEKAHDAATAAKVKATETATAVKEKVVHLDHGEDHDEDHDVDQPVTTVNGRAPGQAPLG